MLEASSSLNPDYAYSRIFEISRLKLQLYVKLCLKGIFINRLKAFFPWRLKNLPRVIRDMGSPSTFYWTPHTYIASDVRHAIGRILCIFPKLRLLHDTLKVFSGPHRIILWMDKLKQHKRDLCIFSGQLLLPSVEQRASTVDSHQSTKSRPSNPGILPFLGI